MTFQRTFSLALRCNAATAFRFGEQNIGFVLIFSGVLKMLKELVLTLQ